MVVFLSPVFEEDLGFVEAVEGLQVEELAAEVAVERLDVEVLPGHPGFDVAGSDAGVAALLFQCLGDEFGAVVATDVDGCSPSALDQALEDGNGLVSVDRAGGKAGERLAGVLVGDVEDLDRPAVCGLV